MAAATYGADDNFGEASEKPNIGYRIAVEGADREP